MHDLPFRASSFDSVIVFHTLTYAEHPQRALEECARVLRPGGRLVILSLDKHEQLDVTAPYGERHPGFSPRALRCLLSRAGLGVTFCRGGLSRGQEAALPGRPGGRREAQILEKPQVVIGMNHLDPRPHPHPHLHPLEKLLRSRIAIIDGAMGTTIRTYGMTEADIRGARFADAKKDLLNNGDLFSLTQPKMIGDIHRRFLEAGADIIETNTFGATSIGQSEFFVDDPREHGGRKDPAFYQKIIDDPFLNDLAWEINEQSARQCREWADRVGSADGRQRFVAGRDRAAHRLALELARRGRRGLPRRDLRSGQGGLRAAGPRAHRRRLGRAPRRDHLRLAQRQGGPGRDRGGVRARTAKRPAGHDLRGGRARRRDDDLRADGARRSGTR